MLAIIFAIFSLILIVVLLWILYPLHVVEIRAADAEDRELGLYCEPETLWEIFGIIDHDSLPTPISHWQVDAVIKALHKRGHVIMGPSKQDVQEATTMLQDGRMWS